MNERLREASHVHARLLKCGLDVESSRTFWSRFSGAEPICAHRAFDEYWFGARSFSRTKVLLAEMKARYCAFPAAFEALRRWQDVSPDTQLLVCHWHVQLADPMYRAFTGEKLVERRASSRPDITRELVVEWVKGRVGKRWNSPTCVLYASKLLSAAHSAGLIASKRDPRVLTTPRVPDDALEYLMYLLRDVRFKGTLFDNPYVKSVGLDPSQMEYRLRRMPGMEFRRQGELYEFGWRYSDILAWANVKASPPIVQVAGELR